MPFIALAELDWLSVLLRAMVYTGSIAVAGSVLVRVTIDVALVAKTVNWQIIIGCLILLCCEPLRYVTFQLAIAQGDWAIAFDPTMRWMAIETPLGQAAGLRLIAAMTVLIGFIWRPAALAGALAMVSTFLLEGHTITHDQRPLLATFLFVHLAIAHWWLAALLPLRAALAAGHDNDSIAALVQDFGLKALVSVAALVIAGLTLLVQLTGWQLDLANAYQQGFAIKLILFTAIFTIAAINKLCWTPLLARNQAVGQQGLRLSINIESAVAIALLFATAIATSFPPAFE